MTSKVSSIKIRKNIKNDNSFKKFTNISNSWELLNEFCLPFFFGSKHFIAKFLTMTM